MSLAGPSNYQVLRMEKSDENNPQSIGVEGKTIYMTGEINNDTISVEMLKHYAEDANKSQSYVNSITKPKITLNMIADGVAIKN